ncbi:MAG: hypothetical protein GF419_08530 [Ignavibacteriales bacterium]|nr:hypothetical protein [Ignavibacteriales bacterium]
MNIIKNSNLVQAFKDPTLKLRPMDQYKAFLYLDVFLIVVNIPLFFYMLYMEMVVEMPMEAFQTVYVINSGLFILISAFRFQFGFVLWGISLAAFQYFAFSLAYYPNIEFSRMHSDLVYTYNNISIVLATVSLNQSLMIILSVLFGRKKINSHKEYEIVQGLVIRKWMPVIIIVATIVMALSVKGHLITSMPYPSPPPSYAILRNNFGSITTLAAVFLLVLVAFLAVQYREKEPIKYWGIYIYIVMLISWGVYFRGNRSGAVMGFAGLALVEALFSNRKLVVKVLFLAISAVTIFILMEVMGFARLATYHIGLVESLQIGLNNELFGPSANLGGDDFNPQHITLFPHMFWIFLQCVNFYHTGIDMGGISFYNLILQVIPRFIADAIGYTRPVSGPILFGQYGFSQGGIQTVGEGYWNWGVWGAMLVQILITGPAIYFENYAAKRNRMFLAGNIAYGGSSAFTLFYGLQALSKTVLFVLLFNWAFAKVYRWASKNALIDYYLDTLRRKKIAERRAEEAESLEGAPPEPAGSS